MIRLNKKTKFFILLLLTPIIAVFITSLDVLFYINGGESISHGNRFKGSLENGWALPFWGTNYSSFSFFSYYLMDNGFVNNKLYNAVVDSYFILEQRTPAIHYHYMECSDIDGGPVWFHRSHRNGTSIDFMSPKIKNDKVYTDLDNWGLAHYFLEFDNHGNLKPVYPFTDFIHPSIGKAIATQLDPKVSIDFETMAQHILALDEACKKNDIAILQVIFKIELKEKLFATKSGKKLRARGIRFASQLPKEVNAMHDEHYHIDFQL